MDPSPSRVKWYFSLWYLRDAKTSRKAALVSIVELVQTKYDSIGWQSTGFDGLCRRISIAVVVRMNPNAFNDICKGDPKLSNEKCNYIALEGEFAKDNRSNRLREHLESSWE